MAADQVERSTERICAEIARLRVLNRCEADLALALAHMFGRPEGSARRYGPAVSPQERECREPSSSGRFGRRF